jgi:hypothetical protein
MLLGAGALSGTGQMNLALAVATAIAATLAADVIWYTLGVFVGARVLEVLARLSLDPDSFVRHASHPGRGQESVSGRRWIRTRSRREPNSFGLRNARL